MTALRPSAAGLKLLAADLVLTDIFMPGLFTLRRVRGAFPHVKVIVLTGGGSYGLHEALMLRNARRSP